VDFAEKEAFCMAVSFGEALRQLRMERNLSQQKLADLLFVDRSTVVRWENGSRTPDAAQITNIAERLGVEVGALLGAERVEAETPNVILVDDERIILSGEVPVVRRVLPGAEVTGFSRPNDAIAYAEKNRVSLAFLDIEMGKISGLDVCRRLLEINPRTNVIFLTSFMEYSYDAWDTGACGFILKPVTPDAVRAQISRLRYPVRGLTER